MISRMVMKGGSQLCSRNRWQVYVGVLWLNRKGTLRRTWWRSHPCSCLTLNLTMSRLFWARFVPRSRFPDMYLWGSFSVLKILLAGSYENTYFPQRFLPFFCYPQSWLLIMVSPEVEKSSCIPCHHVSVGWPKSGLTILQPPDSQDTFCPEKSLLKTVSQTNPELIQKLWLAQFLEVFT